MNHRLKIAASVAGLSLMGIFHMSCGGDEMTLTEQREQIAETICDKIVDCHPEVNRSSCEDKVKGQVAPGQTDHLGEERFDHCLDDIEKLTCNDITTGFDPADPTNFNNVENFVPEGANTCPEIK